MLLVAIATGDPDWEGRREGRSEMGSAQPPKLLPSGASGVTATSGGGRLRPCGML